MTLLRSLALSKGDLWTLGAALAWAVYSVMLRKRPPQMDPMHQKVMMMLPVIFTVFFLFFPSGLVLYWVVNNILSIAQQWYITRKVVGTH